MLRIFTSCFKSLSIKQMGIFLIGVKQSNDKQRTLAFYWGYNRTYGSWDGGPRIIFYFIWLPFYPQFRDHRIQCTATEHHRFPDKGKDEKVCTNINDKSSKKFLKPEEKNNIIFICVDFSQSARNWGNQALLQKSMTLCTLHTWKVKTKITFTSCDRALRLLVISCSGHLLEP